MGKYKGTPSYSSYRGRDPKWKGVLAAVLVLVCLASGGVLFLQRYLIYDETGRPRLELPGVPESQPTEADLPELHIEEPEDVRLPAGVVLRQLPAGPLTAESLPAADAPVSPVVTLRENGAVYFDSTVTLHTAIQSQPDTGDALSVLTSQSDHAVARLGMLRDGISANYYVTDMALMNDSGYAYFDGSNQTWLSPAKPAAVEYLCALAVETAQLGFDELLLTDFSFPTSGKLNTIRYPEAGPEKALTALLEAIRQALDDAGFEAVGLSVELPQEAILAGGDAVAGVDLDALCETADAIYAVCTEAEIPALEEALGRRAKFLPELAAAPSGPVEAYLLLN